MAQYQIFTTQLPCPDNCGNNIIVIAIEVLKNNYQVKFIFDSLAKKKNHEIKLNSKYECGET